MVLYSTSDDRGAWVSSITSQTMELRIAINVQVPYSHLHLFNIVLASLVMILGLIFHFPTTLHH
jgi:hypothetical protein